jgi:hypothetical protein
MSGGVQQCLGATTNQSRCKNRVHHPQQYCTKHAAMYRLHVPAECSICMESLPTNTRPTKCGHYMHTECLQRWMQHHNSCPVCRHLLKQPKETYVRLKQMFDDFAEMVQRVQFSLLNA